MAFSFGATVAPAPAGGGGGFSFGGTPAPAASTSLFGAPTPAPSSTSGGLFGSTTTGGGGLFGSTPATPAPAAAGGGLFGGTPAPSTGLFGSSTTPAPAPTGGLFGAPAPAPAAGSLFGAPAPASGGLFGSTTPAPASGSLFGAPQPAPAMQQQQQYQPPISGNTPYSQLPDNAKRAIDGIYQLMMQHRRTLASVKTMAPALLNIDDGGTYNSYQNITSIRGGGLSPADAAAGSPRRRTSSSSSNVTKDPSSIPLPQQMIALHSQIQTLLQSAESNLIGAQQLKARAGEAAVQAKMHGAWPIENVAARRGVALSTVRGVLLRDGGKNNSQFGSGVSSSSSSLGGNVSSSLAGTSGGGGGGGTPASSLNVSGMDNIDAIALQHIMDIRAAHVDRIEAMPSPYLWDVLRSFEQRLASVQRDVDAVRERLTIAEEAERVQSMGRGVGGNETALLLSNSDNFNAMTSLMLYEGGAGAQAPLSKRLATLARSQNDLFLHIAEKAARAHERLDEVKSRYRRFCESTKGGYYDDPFIKADVEEVSREREMQQKIMEEQIASAPPPPVATAAAPAPSTSLFGATPAAAPSTSLFGASPAPASGGLFGAPAPAPSGGGLFGSTPAPAAGGGLFGSTPAPAAGGLFGSTPAPAPSAGGGLFGSTAPAPATGGGLFGAPAPAGAGGLFSAVPTTPATTLAPKKKPGSRNRRR